MVTTYLTFVVVCFVTLLPVGAEVQSNAATFAVTASVKEDHGDTRHRGASVRHENTLLLRRESEDSSVFQLTPGRPDVAPKGLQALKHSENYPKSLEDRHVRQPEMKTSQAEHHEHTMHQIRRAYWPVRAKALPWFSQLQMVVVRGAELTLEQWKNIAIGSAATVLLLVICISWRAMCGGSESEADDSMEPQMVGPPDFEIAEANGKCSRLVKWCTEDECKEMGIKIHPPPAEFEDYSQYDFGKALSAPLVEALMLKCGVNFRIFDTARCLPLITMKLLRNECHFMTDRDMSKILLMSEGAQVFLNHDGYWLLEEASEDTGPAGSSMKLPSVDKAGGESPVAAATRLWSDDFNMPAHLVRFIEYGADEEEVQTYDGLKCMERNYYVIITLNLRGLEEEDDEALDRLNLDSKSSFQSQSGRQMKWVSQSEVDNMEALRAILPPQNVADESHVRRRSITRNELDASLRNHGINSDVWNGTRGGTVQDFFNELSKGISTLQITPSGMDRVISVVLVRLWDSKKQRLLVELGRIYHKDDQIQTCKPQLPGTRQLADENFADTAQRVVTAQFSLNEDDVHISSEAHWEYMEKVSSSEKFPGMASKYQICFANVLLADDTRLPGPLTRIH